ncbi:A disintegrin and metalloproteinase with thrombospondin motifs 9, partial [Ophiophagus hannah]
MQLVLWAVGLSTLLLQDFLNRAGAAAAAAAAATAARKQGRHLRQAKLLETLREYEIVIPTRVNELGEPLPAKVHFERRKRSLPSEAEPWILDAPSPPIAPSFFSTTQVHYRLQAFGQHFVFNLTAHSGFIAPLFTVSFLGQPEVNQTNFYTEEESDIKHCFYKGHVNTEPQHTAVISLCSGMLCDVSLIPSQLGTFRSHDGEYFVEPLISPDQQEYEEENKKPHIVYRHSVSPTLSPRNKQTCDISGTFCLYFLRPLIQEIQNSWKETRDLAQFISSPWKIEATDPRPQQGKATDKMISQALHASALCSGEGFLIEVKCSPEAQSSSNPALLISFALKVCFAFRQDICRAHDKCDTLGLAELGTVCDPYRSCSISEDSGLSTAFTIAHELGHVFNMPHDDNNKCKEEGGKSQQHVMAPTLNYNTNPWMWSKCSRKYITEFLDSEDNCDAFHSSTGYGECLLDEPSSRTYTLPQQLPGHMYDVNKQCELIFGPGAKHCKYGHCVPKEREIPMTDGAWGAWSPFGACSRTCGGGIKNAIRECNRPEVLSCLGNITHTRRHQLIEQAQPVLMKDRCKLFCRVAGNTAYYQLRDRVIDGTPCGPDTNDICVQGLCRQAGCDHVLNSKARRDKCGVCGGDNSSCKTIAGTFNTVHYGYNTVIRIPAGATNIDVRQHSYSGKPEDDNYLALSSNEGFILNGDYVVSMFKKEIKIGNAVIEYSGSDTPVERINSTYRIDQEIVLQVLSVGNLYNPDVRYTFNIPIEDKPQQFYWNVYGPWQPCSKLCQGTWHIVRKSECSVQCGMGYKTLEISCAKYSKLEGKIEKYDDRYCSGISKPNSREKCSGDCNTGGWRYSAWTECLVTCGKGHKHRQIWCQFGEDRINDRLCDLDGKPDSMQDCQQQECAAWQVGPWGQCTVTCGQGYQMRAVKCVVGAYISVVDDNECNAATKPTDTQCSATCGKGTRMRYVSCRDDHGSVADEAACFHLPKPSATEACLVISCGRWKAMEWSSVSNFLVTRQILCVDYNDQSIDRNECDAEDILATEQDCSMPSCQQINPGNRPANPFPYPDYHQKNNRGHPNRNQGHGHGGNQWRTGPWGACSSTCAGGFQRRVVVCQDENGYAADNCDARMKPDELRSCESGPCPQWAYGSWSECTKSCGGGTRTRLVVCQHSNGERFTDLSCEILDKPPDREQCNMQDCPREAAWNAGPWSSCSVSCGRGQKYREVYCMSKDGKLLENSLCTQLAKPNVLRKCRGGRCPKWKTGDWGQCSKTCGKGSRYRKLICVDQNMQEVDSLHCDPSKKPSDVEICTLPPCEYIWITGDWSECSVTCGKGYKQRLVSCSEIYTGKDHYEYGYQNTVHCPGTPPPNVQSCYLGECPVLASWRVGNWGSVCELPTSCKEAKRLKVITEDGEYFLKVKGRLLKIYCAGMNSDSPKEYITLVNGDAENFSEVYSYRLHNPTECPYNGSRRENCQCRKDYTAAGFSAFSKVRLDLNAMQIITTDLQFAQTLEGRPVPFATAGDCYSAAKCPQDGTKVIGKCGGYCGKCTPSSGTGLDVQVL